jgi:hypothetical protein
LRMITMKWTLELDQKMFWREMGGTVAIGSFEW